MDLESLSVLAIVPIGEPEHLMDPLNQIIYFKSFFWYCSPKTSLMCYDDLCYNVIAMSHHRLTVYIQKLRLTYVRTGMFHTDKPPCRNVSHRISRGKIALSSPPYNHTEITQVFISIPLSLLCTLDGSLERRASYPIEPKHTVLAPEDLGPRGRLYLRVVPRVNPKLDQTYCRNITKT